MEKQLAQWGARLDELAAKVTKSGQDAVEKERKLVVELRAKRDELAAKLQEAKDSGNERWQTIKSGVVSAYEELETTFESVTKNRS